MKDREEADRVAKEVRRVTTVARVKTTQSYYGNDPEEQFAVQIEWATKDRVSGAALLQIAALAVEHRFRFFVQPNPFRGVLQ